MTIKTILVPIYGEEAEAAALEAGFGLAKRYDAHLRCLHISPTAKAFEYHSPMVSHDAYLEIENTIQRELDIHADNAKNWFERLAKRFNVPVVDSLQLAKKNPTASWLHENNLEADHEIALAGRLADVIVISKATTETHESYRLAIIAALFESGRPVILMPAGNTEADFGKHIALAWDGGTRSVHALSTAMPLLRNAKRISILTAKEDKQKGPHADELQLYLAMHNITGTHVNIKNTGISVGKALLSEAANQGADMMVMGAFTHSRIRQIVMGGATNYVLGHATMPIFMMH